MHDFKYSAFISYSHSDEAWAKWLHARLERFRVPSRIAGRTGAHGVVPKRIGRCFRDQTELSAASHLNEPLQQALRDSSALIVICSPRSAASHWVNQEISYFRGLARDGNIYALIVDGEPHSADQSLECFPSALVAPDAAGVVHEPLAADARPAKDGKGDAFLKLASGMLGVGFDELRQREQRRRNQAMAAVIAASLGVAAITTALAAVAYLARNESELRRQQVEAREAELMQVVQFQSGMLKRVDVQELGAGWIEGMRNNIEADLERDKNLKPADRAARLGAFDDLRVRAQPSELARQTLSGFMLAPAEHQIEQQFAGNTRTQGALRLSLAEAYSALGLSSEAVREAQRSAAASRATGDEEHALQADILFARMTLNLGSFEDARRAAMTVAAARLQRSNGVETPESLEAKIVAAESLLKQSRLEEASALYQALEKSSRALGVGHEGLVDTIRRGLGATLIEQGQYAEAERLLTDVYQGQKARLGDDDPETMLTLTEVTEALRSLSRTSEATPYLKQLAAAARRRFGDNHPTTLNYLDELANNLADQGHMKEAGELEEQILAAEKRQLGPENPATLRTMNNHAVTLQSLGRLDEALVMRRQVLEARVRILGPDHTATIYARNNFGVTLRMARHYDHSLTQLRRAYADFLRVLGPSHDKTAETHLELAVTLIEMGQLKEGREQGMAALDQYRRALGPDAPMVLSSESDLSDVLFAHGDPVLASTLSQEALAIGLRTQPDKDLLATLQAGVKAHPGPARR